MTSISYNGLDINSAPYHMQEIEGLLSSPDIRSGDYSKLSRNGMIPGTDRYSGRAVNLNLLIDHYDETSFGDAISALSSAFSAPIDSALPLTFTIRGVASGQTARLYVRPRKLNLPIDFEYFNGASYADIQLFATDPLIYSDDELTATITLAQDPGGMTFPLVFPLVFGGGGSYGSAIVTNDGNADAPVVIRINGPVTNPTVRNVTTGQSLGFTATIASGDYLLVDTLNRTVLLNGTADRYSYLTNPQWWRLAPGDNEIRYFAAITSASTAVITYRSAWL